MWASRREGRTPDTCSRSVPGGGLLQISAWVDGHARQSSPRVDRGGSTATAAPDAVTFHDWLAFSGFSEQFLMAASGQIPMTANSPVGQLALQPHLLHLLYLSGEG